ncbi:uncharacterized protein LOC111707286, partial [Eurytemora carolleeae]|uniref:uncharacterized protein LOC111707286 n=1 Tax=Eurytemora carolleeae TaxID=1294199 RepID=UPI000C78E842
MEKPRGGSASGPKVLFSEEGESVLKQWENMHRPPAIGESIAPSGPVRGGGFGPRSAKSPGHNALAQTHKQQRDRRWSVISVNQTKEVSNFPLKSVKEGPEPRRPSEVWLAETESIDVCALLLTFLSCILILLTLPFSLCTCIK